MSVREHLESEPFAQVGVSAIKPEIKKLCVEFPSDRTIHRIMKAGGIGKKRVPMSPRELSIQILKRRVVPTTAIRRIWLVRRYIKRDGKFNSLNVIDVHSHRVHIYPRWCYYPHSFHTE